MGKIKKFIGEYAYKHIENMAYNEDALRRALVTPANARAVFSDLTEYQIKSLVSEISNSGTIGTVRHTTQEEIKEAFKQGGYSTVIFDDEQAIKECQKYYRDGEIICTYNNLNRRMEEYHMIVAIKNDIDKIKRAENPQRDDLYGTSILNIQIAKNGSHMSIKNRYNHTVSQCDATLNNDLNHITMGLQNMVLGYYGFAGLTNNYKNHYQNVVNIGGVYLKYHTEKNNIYFGDFVLDSRNGARFTDSSRYYITQGREDKYRYMPMVLDFQNKVAIDLIGNNWKVPLVSKAIREGILHSGNKDHADDISVIFTDAKKELLQANKNALKYIAETYGYDFQKPYKIVGILGKFTANSISKIIGDSSALLLMTDDYYLNAVCLNRGQFDIYKAKKGYQYGASVFMSKGGFEEKRKSGNAAVYVIQQDKQYIREVKETRKDKNIYHEHKGWVSEDQISAYELAKIQLYQRLKVYKANKRKAEAQSKDYTAEIKKIDNDFLTLKNELISRLMSANTPDEYRKVGDVMNYKFEWIVRNITKLKEKANTKAFASTQDAEAAIDNIRLEIAKKRNSLVVQAV